MPPMAARSATGRMSPELSERIARRRQEVERIRRRRRRGLLAAGLVVLVVTGVALVLGSNGSERLAVAPNGTGKGSPGGRGETPTAQPAGAQPNAGWKSSKAAVPILMYHVIGEPAGDVPYPDLYLSVVDFREQVDWLQGNSYTPVTLIQVQDSWFGDGTLPPKPIVLSFDDGYLGQYLYAMPILREKGWAGLLNLKAEGSDLSSKQASKMVDAGWEIASHTITHPDLTVISPDQMKEELVQSKRILERDLQIEIVNFCYPAGQYDQQAADAVKAAGYRGATTVDSGLAKRSEPFELKRLRILQGDGAAELATLLGA